jgi:superfamily I DNA/RNA helicase
LNYRSDGHIVKASAGVLDTGLSGRGTDAGQADGDPVQVVCLQQSTASRLVAREARPARGARDRVQPDAVLARTSAQLTLIEREHPDLRPPRDMVGHEDFTSAR